MQRITLSFVVMFYPSLQLVSVEVYLWLASLTGLLMLLAALFALALGRFHVQWLEPYVTRLRGRLGLRAPHAAETWQEGVLRAGLLGCWLLVAFGLFIGLAFLTIELVGRTVGVATLVEVDRTVHQGLQDALSGAGALWFQAVTRLADVLVVALLAGLVAGGLLWQRDWERAWALGMTVYGGMAVVWTLKHLVGRVRPEGGLVGVAGESFPSGHASLGMLFYGFLIYLTWRYVRVLLWRVGLTLLLAALIVNIGLSRVLLSVHWVSDVAGGFIVGLAWLLYSLFVVRILHVHPATVARPASTRGG